MKFASGVTVGEVGVENFSPVTGNPSILNQNEVCFPAKSLHAIERKNSPNEPLHKIKIKERQPLVPLCRKRTKHINTNILRINPIWLAISSDTYFLEL